MFATKMQHDIPGFNMYAAAAAATGQAGTSALNSPSNYAVAAAAGPTRGIVPHYGSSGMDASPYYTPMGGGYDMKAGGDLWGNSYAQPAPAYYPYDGGFPPQYPYDRYCGMDMNDGVRRKNATRESTNTLKAWLQEHKKNPYPTKGEKIMLAIITKMTLTQVSTWFANARRRLKKENKMTWIPKNRANESGSGTEDRRMSDDKDTDDKTEDGDCKSENDENDRVSSDIKSETENENCQYNADKQPSFTLNKDQERTIGETVNSDVVSHSSIESQNLHPDPAYQRMMSHNPCEESEGNIHETGNLQNGAPPSAMRQRSVEGRDRSIWSPINHQAQQNTPHIPHPYSASYDSDVHYPNRSAYPSGQFSQHLPTGNPPQYTADPNISPFPRQTSFHSTSQEYISPPNRTPSSSYSSFQGRQSLSYPMEYNKIENPSSLPIDSTLNSNGRSDCRFTSPVTNLQNYVNGVFHAPETGRSSSPATAPCDKIASMPKTSPNPHNDASSAHSISPTGQMHYRGHGFNQRYVNTIDVTKDSDTMDASVNEAYPLQQSNHSATYTSNGYYGRSMILQDMKHSCSKQDGKEHQGEGPHFTYHANPDIQSPPNVPGNNIENASICPQNEVTGQFPFINQSITGGSGRSLHCPNPKTFLPGSDTTPNLVGHSHNISSNDQICSTVNTQQMPYYNMQAKNCISSAVLSNAPPPLYSSQCQYAHNGTPRSNNPECQSQSLDSNSNQTETVLSTTVTNPGLSSQENCNFEGKRSACEEKGKRNEIQAAEALTNLSTR